jgi:hypothetical protein
MGRASTVWQWSTLVTVLVSVSACEGKRNEEGRQTSSIPAGSGQLLDGMQLESARRVALESAGDAMRARNLERLKQLRTWVEGRASVPIFDADDLGTLDIAIGCLEHVAPPAQALTQLNEIRASKLVQAAREVCTEKNAD